MLEIKSLSSGYGKIPVLHEASFKVADGELIGVLGHNGAGKTTLLRAIAGFNALTHGSVWLNGANITQLAPYKRAVAGLGYVPQGRQIFPALSVRENLTIASLRCGDTIDRALEHFPQLARLLDRPGGALSGGEQQLLALARCLTANPKVILLDEPTEGIQPSIIEEMIETLKLLNKREKLTVVLVEQNLEFLANLADRILIIKRGQIGQEISGKSTHDIDALAALMMH